MVDKLDKADKIDRKEIERIASLAKLNISGENEQFSGDICAMIQMMGKISQIDIPADISPLDMLDMELVNTFREDTPKPSMPRKLVLANAPEIEAGCISVPKIAHNSADENNTQTQTQAQTQIKSGIMGER